MKTSESSASGGVSKRLQLSGIGIGVIVVIALLSAARANAIIINKTVQFGPFGVARGQTARISVANVDDACVRLLRR